MTQEMILFQSLSFLGICKRAGRVTSGSDAVIEEIRNDRAELVLLDEAASENAKKRIRDACCSHQTELYVLPEGKLGHAIGQDDRMAVCLSQDRMTKKLQSLLSQYRALNTELSPIESGHSDSNQCGGKEVDD